MKDKLGPHKGQRYILLYGIRVSLSPNPFKMSEVYYCPPGKVLVYDGLGLNSHVLINNKGESCFFSDRYFQSLLQHIQINCSKKIWYSLNEI